MPPAPLRWPLNSCRGELEGFWAENDWPRSESPWATRSPYVLSAGPHAPAPGLWPGLVPCCWYLPWVGWVRGELVGILLPEKCCCGCSSQLCLSSGAAYEGRAPLSFPP